VDCALSVDNKLSCRTKMNKCRKTPNKNDGSKETEGTNGIRRLPTLLIMFLVVFNINGYIFYNKYLYSLSLLYRVAIY